LAGAIAATGYAYQTSQTTGAGEKETTHLLGTASTGRCGVERWAVKVVTDGATLNLTPKRTNIATLTAMPVPAGMGQDAQRLPEEHQVYQLTGTKLTAVKLEGDSDYHLILQSPQGKTMIAEIPDPACAQGSSVLAQITRARAYFDSTFGPGSSSFRSLNRTVTITGVGFFDVLHGQTGVAPNGIELHTVLSIRVGA